MGALVTFPLWATATEPHCVLATSGCALVCTTWHCTQK